jgi:general secretion pathway protein N
MNLSRLVLAGVGLAVLALISAFMVAPARWVMAVIPADAPLTVVDAHGTLWSGSASLAVGAASHRRLLPDPVQWRVVWLPMPRVSVTHAWLSGPVEMSLHGSGLNIAGQTLQMPASVLSTMDARMAALAPGGDLVAKWPALTFGLDGTWSAASPLDLQWRQATSALSTVRPVGSYRLSATPGDAGWRLQLKTLQGPLMLDGAGSVTRSGIRFDGVARVEPAAPADIHARLTDLLAAIGPRQNDQTLFSIR